jgi:hypothetical protein
VALAACRAGWAAWATWTTKPSRNARGFGPLPGERPFCMVDDRAVSHGGMSTVGMSCLRPPFECHSPAAPPVRVARPRRTRGRCHGRQTILGRRLRQQLLRTGVHVAASEPVPRHRHGGEEDHAGVAEHRPQRRHRCNAWQLLRAHRPGRPNGQHSRIWALMGGIEIRTSSRWTSRGSTSARST